MIAVHLIVATPGRILDLLKKNLVRTDDCKVLILDEVILHMMSIFCQSSLREADVSSVVLMAARIMC